MLNIKQYAGRVEIRVIIIRYTTVIVKLVFLGGKRLDLEYTYEKEEAVILVVVVVCFGLPARFTLKKT